MSAACARPPGFAGDGGGPTLRRGRVGSGVPDAKQTIGYTRDRRTVKVTYWRLFFFCNQVRSFGASNSLGRPSGGLFSWPSATLDWQRSLGR